MGAIEPQLELTLLTRANCSLCEKMKAELAPLLGEFRVRLAEVDVDADAELFARYSAEVPVLLLGSREVARHRLDPAALRRVLAAAGA